MEFQGTFLPVSKLNQSGLWLCRWEFWSLGQIRVNFLHRFCDLVSSLLKWFMCIAIAETIWFLPDHICLTLPDLLLTDALNHSDQNIHHHVSIFLYRTVLKKCRKYIKIVVSFRFTTTHKSFHLFPGTYIKCWLQTLVLTLYITI